MNKRFHPCEICLQLNFVESTGAKDLWVLDPGMKGFQRAAKAPAGFLPIQVCFKWGGDFQAGLTIPRLGGLPPNQRQISAARLGRY